MNWKELNDALDAAKAEVAAQESARQAASVKASAAQALAVELQAKLASMTPYSSTDEALQEERAAGKSALIDYVKANPQCSEAEVLAQWNSAALLGRPAGRQWILHSAQSLRYEYSANLLAAGYVPDASWESFRAFVVAVDKTALMEM
jgi:hypothetical protein